MKQTRIAGTPTGVDRRPFMCLAPVWGRRAGPAAGLLGMVDREQPFHEGTIRVVHAGPYLRAWQQQADENISTVDLPVNVGVIKCENELILYDTGWKQQEYLKMTGSENWAPIGDQLKV